ncbi:hypothetical protein EDB84DRAFT_1568583 [Lactarius hengduanensis]|nr:hypothetical protein EDB84DRAFT_1568583 [Lactarius hengduanensis]
MYYSGRDDSFEDFVQEFEAYADAHGLTNQQRAEAIVRYVAPSVRNSWKSLNTFDFEYDEWTEYLQYLTDIFGRSTPRHEAMRRRLFDFVQSFSRRHMHCEGDVIRYFRLFLASSKDLVLARHLTAEERDIAFFYGFHPDDRTKLRLCLISKAPYQSNHHPFYFEDVFTSACAAFAQEPVQGLEQPPAGLKPPNTYFGLQVVRDAPTLNVETGTGHRAQSKQPKPVSNPTPLPTRPVTPCSRSEHPPGLSRPISSSPPSQQFNDPGERDPQPHRVDMDAGPLVGTPSDSSPTPALSPPLQPSDSSPTSSPPLPASLPPLPAPPPAHSPPLPDSLHAPLPLPPMPPPADPLPPSDSFPVFSLSPSPLVPPSAHSPGPLPPGSFLVPSPCTPRPARSPPLSDLPPTSSPPLPTPLPAHSPPLTDPLPTSSYTSPVPIPVRSLLPSGLLPSSPPPLPLFVHPTSSPPPPSLLLASPEQVVSSVLMSRHNLPLSPFTVSTNLCSPRPSQSPPISPISPAPPRLPPPRPPDTTPADSADSERPLPPLVHSMGL